MLQNAVEHGYDPDTEIPGVIVVSARRLVGRLHVVVEDDGAGLPEGFDLDGSTQLGLSIVRTLVESELRGTLSLRRREPKGTEAILRVPLTSRR